MARHRAAVPLVKHAARGEDQRVFRVHRLGGDFIGQRMELAAPARERFGKQEGRARMIASWHGPLQAVAVQAVVRDAGVRRNQLAHLLQDLGGRLETPIGAACHAQFALDAAGEVANDLPIRTRLTHRGDDHAHALHSAVGVCEGTFFF